MIREIVVWPDSVLRRKCEEVKTFDADLKRLLEDMEHTMLAAKGAGLAAPQVGFALRAVVLLVGRQDPKEGERPYEVVRLVNPTITKRRGTRLDREGCLSLPGFFADVKRAEWVSVAAQDENGNKVEIEGDGYLARALQHELEHLDGVVFVDHLSLIKRNLAAAKFKKAKARGMRYTADNPVPQDFTAAPN